MNSFRSALDKSEGLHPSGPLMPGKKPSGATEAKGLDSVPVPRETSRTVNHRDDDRHRLQAEHATLRVGRKNHQVDLINLSGGGAMIGTDVALPMWQKVHLGLGDCAPVECAVRWIRGDRIGLEFAITQVAASATRCHAARRAKRSFPESWCARRGDRTAGGEATSGRRADRAQRRDGIRHPL